jgi:hypothetical protein
MSQAQAVYVKAPRVGEVSKFATIVAPTPYLTPTHWKGRWVRFYAEGADLYIVFAPDTNVTPSVTAVGARDGTTFKVSPNNESMPLVASSGTFTSWFLLPPPKVGTESGEEYFYVASNNATGYWSAHVSDHGPGVPA